MARGYDRLEYSLMNDIYDEQVYGYGTNSYANESYYNGADYSDYESYNDGYKNGYRAAMEAFGKKKKGFFANIWQKILDILKAIRKKLAKLFGKKKSVPQKVWDAVTSEKVRLIAAITAGVSVMTGIVIKVVTGFKKYKQGNGSDSASFIAYLKQCGNDFRKAFADHKSKVKAAGGFDSKKGPMKDIILTAGVSKTEWYDSMAKFEETIVPFTKREPSPTDETNNDEVAKATLELVNELENANAELTQMGYSANAELTQISGEWANIPSEDDYYDEEN